MPGKRIATLLAAMAALAVITPVGRAAPAPADDSFFVPPNPLPAGAPGDIIRSRPSQSGPLLNPAKAWQIMYVSTNALGQRDAVVATVLVPRNVDPATVPIVGFAAGTQGPAFKCRPSNMFASYSFYEQPAVNDMLGSGYAVVVPDYEGYQPSPRTTYMAGRSMGPALIDAIRAAQRLPDTRLSTSAKVMFRGYSQGGGAAMWAGQLQPSYAPDLNLVGVIGGGVPADLTQVALPLEGGVGFGLLFYALIGLDHTYPELNLDSSLNPAGRAERVAMQQSACTLELLLNYRNKRLGEDLRVRYCALGVSLLWKAFVGDHITLVYTGIGMCWGLGGTGLLGCRLGRTVGEGLPGCRTRLRRNAWVVALVGLVLAFRGTTVDRRCRVPSPVDLGA